MENPITQALQAIKGFVTNASQPERSEPGPGDVGPSTEVKHRPSQMGLQPAQPTNSLVTLPMTEEEAHQWWERINRARTRVKARAEKWDLLLAEYLPVISKSGEAETVKVQQHFRNVHSKIGQLFYRSPDLVLSPREPSLLSTAMPNPMSTPTNELPPMTMEDIVTVKQAVLQLKLGRDGIKANRLMDELLFDVLAWAGIGASKLGYRCVYKEIPAPQMPEQPGNVLGLQAPNMMAPPPIPVPIFEEWYWRRFSPKKALWNDDLRSTRFDEDATWMGMEGFMSPKRAMKAFGLTEEEAAKAASDDLVYLHAEDSQGSKAPGLVHYVEIFCKASFFTDELHPQAMNQLVMIEGIPDRPVVWRPSPDQDFDEMGQLTKDSLIGFPFRILTIRDLADSSFPVSDSGFTNSEIKQLSTWRRQSIQLRDAAIGKYLYDDDAFTPEEVQKLQSTEIGVFVGVQGGKLAQGAEKVFTTTAQVTHTQDDYRGQQLIQQDVDQTLGISAMGAGAPLDTVRSATEVNNVQNAMSSRNDKEQGRVVDFYLDGARMIDQLLMRYADAQDYVEITGTDGAKRMQMWNRNLISGKYLYDIAPDSMLRMDTARDFQMAAQHWNLVAKSPLTNQSYILRRMARMRGLDPAKAVLSKPPEQKEEMKMSMTFKGEDLANPLVILLMVKMGIITMEEAGLNQPVLPPAPEGAADKADVISQHTASNSGGRENAPGSTNFRASQAGD